MGSLGLDRMKGQSSPEERVGSLSGFRQNERSKVTGLKACPEQHSSRCSNRKGRMNTVPDVVQICGGRGQCSIGRAV